MKALVVNQLHCFEPYRAEVELVEEEVVGVDCLQSERPECGGGEVLHVGGDDALRAALGGCRDDVPVVGVG
jgi:hypothetical protein